MDSFDSRYGKNTSKTNGSVDAEVQRLLRKGGKVTSTEFLRLRSLGKDEEIVNKIQTAYLEKQGNITKKARKFAQLIREKYSDSQTPFHLLLEKAHKYKVKYGLTDDEFAEFQRIYEQELVGIKSSEVVHPFTNVQKLLGGITLDVNGFTSKLSDSDARYLQEIVKLYETSRGLHAQVLLQSMQYKDLDFEALTGDYDRNLHKIGEHIHPVVAALFLPKFDVVENFFLFSNLAGIVKSKYEREELKTLPDYELFYALSTDPNDVVCDNKSTVADLLTRARVQTQLWNNVLALRNGQYYNASFKDFVGSVDSCRLNKQDTPDLVYGRYDGVIIKRLLAAFSFRPTVVSTLPVIVNNNALNPYALNVKPQVTSVPMINMRLPPTLNSIKGNTTDEIELEDALQQYQFFIEGGQIVPRSTNLIWSRGILVFYVDRRATTITINDQVNQFSMSRLPTPIAGFEKINQRKVKVPHTIGNKDPKNMFELRSVVYSEVNVDTKGESTDTVVGSSTLLRKPSLGGASYLCYDPYGPIASLPPTSGVRPRPISQVSVTDEKELSCDFTRLANTRGTVFIYSTNVKWNERQDFLA
jgi:hypothetical protein